MNRVLRRVDGFVENTDQALDMLTDVEDNILNQLSRRMSHNETSKSRRLDLCNLQDNAWKSAATDQIELRFPVKSTTQCVTDFIPKDQQQRQLHRIIYNFNKMKEDNAANIAKEAKTNFTDADTIFDFPFNTATQTCKVNALGAYRVNKTWFLNIGITSEKKEKHLGDFERHYLVEVMSRGGGYGNMTLPVRPPDGVEEEEREVRSDTTTIMVTHRSTAEPAFFKPVFLDENVAVVQALSSLEHYTQQASDAMSPSSITILFFPLWLNLVPIALLADVSSMKMIIYALLSDVLTALPLAIKGVELMWIGSHGSIGTVVRMSSGLDGTRAPTAAAEVYVAECHARGNLRAQGIVFLTIAIVFLVGGLVAEFAARHYRARLRKKVFHRVSVGGWSSGSESRRWSDSHSSDGFGSSRFIGTSFSALEASEKGVYCDEKDSRDHAL
ncbi:hypothetical protein FGB62_3g339 [Gracilaria domingensis]|nr:hypothetical protein FGB62_3g339 [Gracilaria domingensis]